MSSSRIEKNGVYLNLNIITLVSIDIADLGRSSLFELKTCIRLSSSNSFKIKNSDINTLIATPRTNMDFIKLCMRHKNREKEYE